MKKHYDGEEEILLDNPTFVHEVPEDEVKRMQFEEKKKARKMLILVLLIIFFSILLIGMGFYYSFNSSGSVWGNQSNADLFVVHSKTDFGDTIANVKSYDGLDNSFDYTFYVENQNKYNLWYKVIVEDNYDSSSKVNKFDKTKIFYAIEKNDETIFKGTLDSDKETTLTTAKLLAGKVDNYKIRFWTETADAIDGYYRFKVRVEI